MTNAELGVFALFSCSGADEDSFQIEKTICDPDSGVPAQRFVFSSRSTGWDENPSASSADNAVFEA
jgi:hypothetical protein